MYFVLKYGQIRVLYCRIMFKEGNWLLIFWLMMGLAIGSSKELVYMLMHIIGAGFERLKLLIWPKSFPISGFQGFRLD